MLKNLVILAVIWTFQAPATVSTSKGQTAPLGTPEKRIAESSLRQDGQANPQSRNGNQGTANTFPPGKNPTTPTCDEACQQGRDNLAIQRKLEWFTGGLVIVGFLQAGTMIWQAALLRGTLRQVQTQAGHMETQSGILGESVAIAKQSAEVTRQQIELYVNAERARMTMEVREVGRSFAIEGQNTGKAIAKITQARGVSVVLKGQELPAVPPYLSKITPIGDFVEWVDSGKKIDLFRDNDGEIGLIADLSTTELCNDIRDLKSVLWVYGRICYGDGISPIERETRFCYQTTVDNGLEIGFCASGPAI